MKSKFLYQDVDVVSLADKGIVVRCFVFRIYDKVLMETGYCLTPYQRLWLYNGSNLVAFYDTLGIRSTYSRLYPPASSRGKLVSSIDLRLSYLKPIHAAWLVRTHR